MNEIQVLYICDREKCEDCFNSCNHTTDISHAKNFKLEGNFYVEDDGKEIITDDRKILP